MADCWVVGISPGTGLFPAASAEGTVSPVLNHLGMQSGRARSLDCQRHVSLRYFGEQKERWAGKDQKQCPGDVPNVALIWFTTCNVTFGTFTRYG